MRAHGSLAVPPWLICATAIAGASLAGFAMAYRVGLGLAVVAAICFVPLAFLNLRLAIVLWLPFVSLIGVYALDVGPTLAGVLIGFVWLGTLASRRSNTAALIVKQAPILVPIGALVLWVVLSIAWAPSSPIGSEVFFGWLAAAAIVLVIATTLTDRRYLRLAVVTFVGGVVFSVALGLFGGAVLLPVESSSELETTRLVGGSGDPNVLAAGIVPAIVLALGFGVGRHHPAAKLAGLATVLLLTVGLVDTGSRGGFVAAIVAAAAVFVLAKHHRPWVLTLLLCGVGAAVAWFSVDPEVWQRLSNFSDSNGRTELWGVAWQMWQGNPIAGVGLEGFGDNGASYARELGSRTYAEFITERPHVVHNTYLQLLAETGVVGLMLFGVVVVESMRRAWRAANVFERMGDASMAALARGVLAATVAMLASVAFISGGGDRRLWLLLALGPALLACAELSLRRIDGVDPALPPPDAQPDWRRARGPAWAPTGLSTGIVRGAATRPSTD